MKSAKVLKSLLVLGLICSTSNVVVHAEETTSIPMAQLEESEKLVENSEVTAEETISEVSVTSFDELKNAIDTVQSGGIIKLENDISTKENLQINKSITLDLNGHDFSLASFIAKLENTKLIIKDSKASLNPTVDDLFNVSYESGSIILENAIYAYNGATVILENGKIDSNYLGLFAFGDETGVNNINSTVIVNGGYIVATEFGVSAQGKGATAVVNDGVVQARDNAAVSGNGTNSPTKKLGDTIIEINGGTLIGNITSDGYASCGIYHPQRGKLTVTGGTIYSSNGCGILMRGGELNMTGGTIVSEGDKDFVGKVGDSKITVTTSGIVFDTEAGYYDGENTKINILGDVDISGSHSSIHVVAKDTNVEAKKRLKVTGGTYSSNVSEFVADGYTLVEENGNFVVKENAKGLDISKESVSLYVGNSTVLTAKPNGYVTDNTVTWSSSNDAVATVDANGNVTAVSVGSANITASVNGFTATCVVTVEEKPYIPPYIPSTPDTTPDVEGSTTESGEKVEVDEVRTDSEVKETLGKENVITSVEVEKVDEPVEVTVNVGKKLKDETVYVVQQNPKTNELELVATSTVDKKGNVVFTTESTEKLTLTTALPEGFINTVATSEEESVTYYITEENEIKKGWLETEEGTWYYFNYETGAMYKNTWASDGQDAKGNPTWYFLNADGSMKANAWIWRDSESAYYVDANGKMVYGPTTVDGYAIDANGLWHK